MSEHRMAEWHPVWDYMVKRAAVPASPDRRAPRADLCKSGDDGQKQHQRDAA